MTIATLSILALLAAAPDQPLAAIRLYNPTSCAAPALVEIPTGHIAAPGALDWSKVRLLRDGIEIPFALREGRPHQKAALAAPPTHPRPEDVLVFSLPVAPGQWARIDLVPGAPDTASALAREEGRIRVAYPDGTIEIDETSGLITRYQLAGGDALKKPLNIACARLRDNGYEIQGAFGPGYARASVSPIRGDVLPMTSRLLSSHSTPAMTELHFEFSAPEGPKMGVTYRLYRSGALEILADERPWEGPSPWLDHAVEYTFPNLGDLQPLPLLEDRWPFYGFRDYNAAVHATAEVRRSPAGDLLVLGDETVNGRRFVRRLYPIPSDQQPQALAELVDEGLIIEVLPVRMPRPDKPVKITAPDSIPVLAQELSNVLKTAAIPVEDTPDAFELRLDLQPDSTISGDGYAFHSDGDNALRLRAVTPLGLCSAVHALADHFRRHGTGAFPLVASNPVVDLRAGGFGGGDFEVDFPYGPDEEWFEVFDNLLASGMNTFACLGMWGNWKMPVGYRHMPELRSDAPDAYDESSGAKFAELDAHRDHGLKLMRYLQERGARVWLWLPIGCVPTTFAQRFPDAMAPGTDKFPCFTHPEYRRYVDAFLRELLETYPIDGLVLIRDDNGGICSCDRCQQYVESSRTKSPVWEQYLVIYDWLRTNGFKASVGVYPYFDAYEPRLDPLLPPDLYIIGHGAGLSVLSRDFDYVGPMGDTWLDNLYANFRLPPTPRMRRLLADRGSFWIGGAYRGTELPWLAVGAFGREPTATPNTLRYDWGLKTFGKDAALPFLRMTDAYEHLWDLNARYMPPGDWIQLSPEERARIVAEGTHWAAQYRARLAELEAAIDPVRHERWLGHVRLFAPFFEYHIHRLDKFSTIRDKVTANLPALETGLPPDVRASILADYAEIYARATNYDAAMKTAPTGGMLDRTRWMTSPYKEWMAGYDQWLDGLLDVKQFAGTGSITTGDLRPGQPFTLRVELHNRGLCPWVAEAGHRLEFSGIADQLGLPSSWPFEGDPIAPGDTRVIEFNAKAPDTPGEGNLSAAFISPYRAPEPFIKMETKLTWNQNGGK